MNRAIKDYYVFANTESVRNKLIETKDMEFIFSYNNTLVMARDLLKLYDYLSDEVGQFKDQLRLSNEGSDAQKGERLIEDFKKLLGLDVIIYDRYFIEESSDFSDIHSIVVLEDIFAERFVEKIVISGSNFCFGNFENIKNQIIEITPTSFSYNKKKEYNHENFISFDEEKVSINRNYYWKIDFNTYKAESMFGKLSKEISKIFKYKEQHVIIYDANSFNVKVIFEDGLEITKILDSSFVGNGYKEISKILSSYFPKMCEKPIYL